MRSLGCSLRCISWMQWSVLLVYCIASALRACCFCIVASLIHVGAAIAAKDAGNAASELSDTLDGMASEHWPGFKKEYLKPKVARKMIEDRKVYNRTKKDVHGVLNLIEFKRARKLT